MVEQSLGFQGKFLKITASAAFAEGFPKLGTRWVAPGEGSTWRELYNAFRSYPTAVTFSFDKIEDLAYGSKRTNLKLTGQPLTPADRARWDNGAVL